MPTPQPTPLLLRWQGLLARGPAGWLGSHLEELAGLVLCALLAVLPVVSRSGLSLLLAACVLLWVVWALRTPPGKIGAINLALLAVLAVAVLATGFSPVPLAAAKGLIKLGSYLGVYALMRQLLAIRRPDGTTSGDTWSGRVKHLERHVNKVRLHAPPTDLALSI